MVLKITMKSDFKRIDRGKKHILSQIEAIGRGVSFTTGLHSPEGSMLPRFGGVVDGKVNIAQYAFWNEFGTEDIPARPTFGPVVRNTQQKFIKQTRLGIKRVHRGGAVKGLMTKQSRRAKVWLKAEIMKLSQPANSPKTLVFKRRRGRGSNPLIDSGSMHNSITSKIHYPGKPTLAFRRGLNVIEKSVRRLKP